MSVNDAKADEWMKKAAAAKHEDAAEMYTRAGNCYKISKSFDKAGEAFCKAAECYLKLQSNFEAANSYISASTAYSKANSSSAITTKNQAIKLFIEANNFNLAARYQRELAEAYEHQHDLEKAVVAYQIAADFFESEAEFSNAARMCLVKIAWCCSELERYDKAIELYERVAEQSIDNNSLKWSVKDYLYKAGLCRLAKGDMVATERALLLYKNLDATFSNSIEGSFLQGLVDACKNCDTEAFAEVVNNYGRNGRELFDTYRLILKIKNSITQAVNDLT